MKIIKRVLIALVLSVTLLAATTYLFMQQSVFGKNPSGERLKRIEKSVNYKNGSFQNLNPTVVTKEGASMIGMLSDFLSKPKNVTPAKTIPSVKTNLKQAQADKPLLIWFGHSSYLIKSQGSAFLIDPVFSGSASPVSFFGRSFTGSDVYGVEDFPAIDGVIITHDHYDHLDYPTIKALKATASMFYVPLGVGAHLEHWGVAPEKIIELDWWESTSISSQIELIATPARHFSGRGFQRGKTLWASYVFRLHGYSIVLGGDSGYDSHFKEIGTQYGPFDLAILEAGQYGKDWPYIHMFPPQTVQAAADLRAKVLLPVHWSKFALALHPWNEPIREVVKLAKANNLPVTTPLIGEPIIIDSVYSHHTWWNF